MRIVKVETVTYDPEAKTLSFSGVNRFSRHKQASIFIEDDVKFIETIHQLLANSDTASVDFTKTSDKKASGGKGKKKKGAKAAAEKPAGEKKKPKASPKPANETAE
ncbi:MAG: hypothetical protein J0H18_16390 [Rhizobiales bacterium]|nr:hypothetical protein [Hyphomicrobiales bacterium]OJX99371.1 MAG: hypothetical protein BGP07_04880 [Rhizobiales bacterium 63-22]